MYLLADQNFTFRAWKYDENSKQATNECLHSPLHSPFSLWFPIALCMDTKRVR